MRHLITSDRTDTRIILGYDARGLLCELQVMDAVDVAALEWTVRHAPIHEADVRKVFHGTHLKFTVLHVNFNDFWLRYAYKEGKLDATRAWERLSQVDQQLAYDYIERYRAACHRDRKALMHPATYLRAKRWLDHT